MGKLKSAVIALTLKIERSNRISETIGPIPGAISYGILFGISLSHIFTGHLDRAWTTIVGLIVIGIIRDIERQRRMKEHGIER